MDIVNIDRRADDSCISIGKANRKVDNSSTRTIDVNRVNDLDININKKANRQVAISNKI